MCKIRFARCDMQDEMCEIQCLRWMGKMQCALCFVYDAMCKNQYIRNSV